MDKINIFDKKYSFAVVSEIVEYIFDLFHLEKHEDKSILKERTLYILKKVLDLDILKVSKWLTKLELNDRFLSTDEIIKHIDEIWFDEAGYSDFYAMLIFESPDWYKSKLKALGLTHTTDRDCWFVENKIGNLEKWIKENRPKE